MINKDTTASAKKRVATLVDYKKTFSSDAGQKVIWDLMREHYVYGNTFHENTHEMAFREGQRNVVLRILSNLKVDIEQLIKKIDESIKDSQKYQQGE